MTNYATSSKLDILKVFEEKISGAKKNTERPILQNCIEYCIKNQIDVLLVSELSRLGRNTFELLGTVQQMIESGVNIYLQKENLSILDDSGKPSFIVPVLLATLGTAAQLERENIQYRLNSGRAQYINNGGQLGRTPGSVKSKEKKEQEYSEVIRLLNKQHYTLKEIAKLSGVSLSTVQRVKREFLTDTST